MYRSFEKLAKWTTDWTGSTSAFVIALATIILWILSGIILGYSDTWQLVINTATTIITFLMVFLLQRAHNKDSLAMHMKLNELIASHNGASNNLLNIENLTEEELRQLQKRYERLTKATSHEDALLSHTIEKII